MIDRDIWITANEMIKLYGDDALLKLDDEADYAVWKRIVATINELRSAEPSGPLH
jgi:hypothetical protein